MPPARTIAGAADAFLTRATAATTRRSYGQTMNALTAAYTDAGRSLAGDVRVGD